MWRLSRVLMEPVLPLFDRLLSGRNTTIRSDPHKHADQVAHLKRDHRHRRDQRGGEGALFMYDLNRTGEDNSQQGCWDENPNFEAESEDGADEK